MNDQQDRIQPVAKTEVVVYQPNDTISLEVKFDGETVWLTQDQMCQLFGRDQSVISRHIANVFKEQELHQESNMHFLHIANSDKPVKHFSLDVVISVGYRVKSQMGTRFRIWATKIIRSHMLPRQVPPLACISSQLEALESRVGALEVKVEDRIPPREYVFFEGQIFDAYTYFCDRIREARKRIIVVDNYVDDRVLTLLDKRGEKVAAVILTGRCKKTLQLDVSRHNEQYKPVRLLPYLGCHDRFLIIDKLVYHVGCSMKDAGRSGFAVIRMEASPQDILKPEAHFLLS